MINFLFCTLMIKSTGASKVDQTHKFEDFLDLTVLSDFIVQCFDRNKSCQERRYEHL